MVGARIEVKQRQDNLIDLTGVVVHGPFSVRITSVSAAAEGRRLHAGVIRLVASRVYWATMTRPSDIVPIRKTRPSNRGPRPRARYTARWCAFFLMSSCR